MERVLTSFYLLLATRNQFMQSDNIQFYPQEQLGSKEPQFSILIPTWNNLPHLKLCIESIVKNSRYAHQLIIHVNEGSDGTLDWVRSQNYRYSHSSVNSGVCYAFNAAASLAESQYLLLLDDDNYMLPDWDYYIIEEIKQLNHPYFALSATKIERRKTFNQCAISPHDFGSSTTDFDEEGLLKNYQQFQMNDWTGSSWYPMAIHKSVWDLVGGMSIEYTPGMYSDPDFMMKLWQAGVRHFKGISDSRAYHFMSKSVRRVKKNNGRKQFLLKWGISNSTFREYYLRMGQPFNGPLADPQISAKLKLRHLRDKIKILFST